MRPSYDEYREVERNNPELRETFSASIQPAEAVASATDAVVQGTEHIDELSALFRPLSEFEESEASWLVPGWIPDNQITLVASDGGVGKTTLWVHIVAALSSGRPCILDPPGHKREPLDVVFCTTEDSIRKKLLRKLREAGAEMAHIRAMDLSSDRKSLLREFKFGSMQMDTILRQLRASVCVFDPVQGFIPPDVNMGSRNAMRDCMAPLISIGEDIGTTFIIICHTNKRKGAYGRDRIADSADLWDIARSVIMMGYTPEMNLRYIAQEKNNYWSLQETVLFEIGKDGQILPRGTTWKHDRDFVSESGDARSAPKRNDCKESIIRELTDANGGLPKVELDARLKAEGFSDTTIKRAKTSLREENKILYDSAGSGRNKTKEWYVCLANDNADAPDPF